MIRTKHEAVKIDIGDSIPSFAGIKAEIPSNGYLLDIILKNFFNNLSKFQREDLKERFNQYFAKNPEEYDFIKNQEIILLNNSAKKKRVDSFLKSNSKLLIVYCASELIINNNYVNKRYFQVDIHTYIREQLPKIKGYNTDGKIKLSAITTRKNVFKFYEELEQEGIFEDKGINEDILKQKYDVSLSKLKNIYQNILIPFYNESSSDDIFKLIKNLPTGRRNQTYTFNTNPADFEKLVLFFKFMPRLIEAL